MKLLNLFKTHFAAAVTRLSTAAEYEALKRIEADVLALSASARRLSETVAKMSGSVQESRKP